MSWSIVISGHEPGDTAADVEAKLVEVARDAAARVAEVGTVSSATFSGQSGTARLLEPAPEATSDESGSAESASAGDNPQPTDAATPG